MANLNPKGTNSTKLLQQFLLKRFHEKKLCWCYLHKYYYVNIFPSFFYFKVIHVPYYYNSVIVISLSLSQSLFCCIRNYQIKIFLTFSEFFFASKLWLRGRKYLIWARVKKCCRRLNETKDKKEQINKQTNRKSKQTNKWTNEIKPWTKTEQKNELQKTFFQFLPKLRASIIVCWMSLNEVWVARACSNWWQMKTILKMFVWGTILLDVWSFILLPWFLGLHFPQ